MDALAAAATIVQLVSFTGEILALGYGYIAKAKGAPSEIRALLRETANLNALLDQLQQLVDVKDSANINGALEMLSTLGVFKDCEGLMRVVKNAIKACDHIEGQQVKNFGKKILWPFKGKETKDTMAQLGRLREALSAAVVVDSAKTLWNLENVAHSIDQNVIEARDGMAQIKSVTRDAAEDIAYVKTIVEAKIQEEEQGHIQRWLHLEGIESEASFTVALSQRSFNTGTWLIKSNELRQWMASSHTCMWLYGIAGCGKTVLSSTIIDYLRDFTSTTYGVIYFFCDRRDPVKQSFQDLLYAVLKQLLDQDVLCFEVVKRWRDDRKDRAAGSNTITKPLEPLEYIELVKNLSSRWDRVDLVVDAVDECVGLSTFVGGLRSLVTGSNIRLLMTSRHDVELQRSIGPIAEIQISVADLMQDDINTYLTSEVIRRTGLGLLKFKENNLDSLIVKALQSKARGMILIAKLQLDYICKLKSDRAIKQALIKLPSGIYPTYDEILYQICSKRPDEVYDIKRMLQWLVYSMVPLTLEQVAEIISLRLGDKRLDESGISTDLLDMAASLGSLVTLHVQDTSGNLYEDLRGSQVTLITLAHYSVEEYLKSGQIGQGLSNLFHMDSRVVHLELAKTCLQYIGFDDFAYPLKKISERDGNGAAMRPDLHKERRLLRHRTSGYAFYDYACRYWGDHLRQSNFPISPDSQTAELLYWFTNYKENSGNYISWQQMYHRDVIYYCPGRPSLYYAIEFQIDSLVSLLFPPNEYIDTLVYGVSALHVAARCGALTTVQELLHHGASVDVKSSQDPRKMTSLMTPLHFAAEGGHVDVIRLLLAHGASPSSRNESGSTPFFRAARSGSLQAMKVLYDAGSDINVNKKGYTPLFESVAHCRPRVATQLLHWGADPTIVNYDGHSTLSLLKLARMNALHKNRRFVGGANSKGPAENGNNHWEGDEISERAIHSNVMRDNWVTEEEIYREILEIRSQGLGPEGFKTLLRGLRIRYILKKQMEKDTRPGTEREKDLRYGRDPTMIITFSEFRDRGDDVGYF